MRRLYQISRILLVNTIILVVGIVAIELYLRSSSSGKAGLYHVWPPNMIREFHPDPAFVPGVSQISRFETNSLGIRGLEFNHDAPMKILAIGGSTTEELYLDRPESWTGRLESMLNEAVERETWVGNIGKSGATSETNLLQARHILPQLPPLTHVLWLVGINDALYMLRTGYKEFASETAHFRIAFMSVPPLEKRWFESTALYRAVQGYLTYKARADQGTVQSDRGEWLAKWREKRTAALSNPPIDELPPISEYLDRYRATITEMVELVQGRGAKLVVMTQPALWRENLPENALELMWAGGEGPPGKWNAETRFYTHRILNRAMDALNATALSVCEDFELTCVDTAAAVPPEARYYYDDMHFTIEGSRIISSAVFDALNDAGDLE